MRIILVLAFLALVPQNALAHGAEGYPPPDWTCTMWSPWRQEGRHLVRKRTCRSPSGSGVAVYHSRKLYRFCFNAEKRYWYRCRR